MTLTTELTTVTIRSGAILPLAALPQGELLTVNETRPATEHRFAH